jgi:hypothetical protein
MKALVLRDFKIQGQTMRSKTMAIMAAAVLFLPTVAHAQPLEGSAPDWTFAVLTIWNFSDGRSDGSHIKREPYGVFTSRDDCDMARAKKADELDRVKSRLPHLPENAVVTTTTVTNGVQTITTSGPKGPTECTSPIVLPKN